MSEYERWVSTFGYVDNLVGMNEHGENVIVNIDKENATFKTIQKNGYIRTNVYWPDGTEEELYS